MVRFIVDTTFCLTKGFAEANKIKLVPLTLILDEKESAGGFEEEWGEFYSRFRDSKGFPSTSRPNPSDYEDKIDEIYLEDPNAEIIILTVASGLSGALESAIIAAKSYPDKKIAVIDSENATASCNLMLCELLEFAAKGHTFSETVLEVERLKNKLSIVFIPDTMEYLRRGGRIGKLGAILASIVSIKPVFDFSKNKVTIVNKVLGLKNAVDAMIKRLPEKIKKLYVCYIYDNKNVPLLLDKLSAIRSIKNPIVKSIDPVFGIHVGFGAIGLACLEE